MRVTPLILARSEALGGCGGADDDGDDDEDDDDAAQVGVDCLSAALASEAGRCIL